MATVALTSTTRSAAGKSDEEVAIEAIKNLETLSRNYVPIINPANRKPMLQLKKHGECTLVDPRACFAHYECAADIACILYAHVSLRYFHCLAMNGYISNKERVVLRDIEYGTYVFVMVENIRKSGDHTNEDVDSILKQVQRPQGHCRPGADILNGTLPGSEKPGYVFTQPVSLYRAWKTNSRDVKRQHRTTKVIVESQWQKRIKAELESHRCQRNEFNARQKQDMDRTMTCRRPSTSDDQYRFYIPIIEYY